VFTISQQFYFDAAHSLETVCDSEATKRIHGHSYRAEVFVSGPVSQATGMVFDLRQLRKQVEDVQSSLDHRNLDEIAELGLPTLENITVFIWRQMHIDLPARLTSVRVWRNSVGDSCTLSLKEVSIESHH
jgi:6-pyruvoyltetrahydropterin/6-carboxytetrahydropterin synthase